MNSDSKINITGQSYGSDLQTTEVPIFPPCTEGLSPFSLSTLSFLPSMNICSRFAIFAEFECMLESQVTFQEFLCPSPGAPVVHVRKSIINLLLSCFEFPGWKLDCPLHLTFLHFATLRLDCSGRGCPDSVSCTRFHVITKISYISADLIYSPRPPAPRR